MEHDTLSGARSRGGRTADTSMDLVELRRYALVPGRREDLIELFEAELLRPQELVGMRVLGQFRDPHDDNAFVWLRGFSDRAERAAALTAFYGGAVWQRYRDAANATMLDSDDVMLLRPLLGWEVTPDAAMRGMLVVVYDLLDQPSDADVVAAVRSCAEALGRAGAPVQAAFRTDEAPNDYPALPVREGEDAVVVIASYDRAAPPSASTVAALGDRVRASSPTLTWLEPTPRSAWQG